MKTPDDHVCPKCGKLKLKRDGSRHKCGPTPMQELAALRAENAGLREANDKRIEDFLAEKVCCNGVECGCQGATRLEQEIFHVAGPRITTLNQELAALRARVAELEQDKARLDWLLWQTRPGQDHVWVEFAIPRAMDARAAIDAAMKPNPTAP